MDIQISVLSICFDCLVCALIAARSNTRTASSSKHFEEGTNRVWSLTPAVYPQSHSAICLEELEIACIVVTALPNAGLVGGGNSNCVISASERRSDSRTTEATGVSVPSIPIKRRSSDT